MCGISGLKPTYGVVSRYGMIAFASSLDQGGPMAKSADDLALLLNVLAGFDARDSTSLERPPERLCARPRAAACGPAHRPAEGIFRGGPRRRRRAARSSRHGRVRETRLQRWSKSACRKTRLSVPAYYVLAPAEASSNLARYDGVRYGYRAPEYGDLADMYKKTRAQGFGAEVKRRILIGTYVLSHGYYDAYYLQAQKIRRLIAQDFTQAFQQLRSDHRADLAHAAFELGAKTADPVQMYLTDIYTIAVNLAGLPGHVDSLRVRRRSIGRSACRSSATISRKHAC